jgi:hypothetical protein
VPAFSDRFFDAPDELKKFAYRECQSAVDGDDAQFPVVVEIGTAFNAQ